MAGEPITSQPVWRSVVRGNVFLMGLVSLFTDLSSEMIYPLLPIFIGGLVAGPAAAVYVGAMEGIAESTASLLKLVSGRVSDRLGKRKLLAVAGYGISSVVRPLMAVTGAAWQVVFLRFADRIGKGIRTAPRDALISDSVPASARGLAFSFHRAMDHTGAIGGSLAGIGILGLLLGYGLWKGSADAATAEEMRALRILFAVAAVPGILAMLSLVPVRETAVPPEAACAGPAEGAGHARLPATFHRFVGVVTVFALGNSSDLFLLFYGKTKFGFGLAQLMALWVALHAAKMVFSVPGGILSDRFGRRPMIVAGWLVYMAVYLGMALVDSPGTFWVLFTVYGLYYGLTEGVEKAMVADFVPSAQRGSAYGLYHAAVGLAALPASLLFGVFWAALGPERAFGIGAALAGAATVLLLLLVRPASPAGKAA